MNKKKSIPNKKRRLSKKSLIFRGSVIVPLMVFALIMGSVMFAGFIMQPKFSPPPGGDGYILINKPATQGKNLQINAPIVVTITPTPTPPPYSESAYYAESSYPPYSQSAYTYSQSSYTYSQSAYTYSQSSYYSESSYYFESTYQSAY